MPLNIVKSFTGLANRSGLEELLVEISTLFINLPVDQIDSEIENAQYRICELLDIDRSSLWQIQEQEPEMTLLTHFSQPSDGPEPPARLNLNEFWPWLMQKMMDGETFNMQKLTDLPAEASRDRESFALYRTKSGVYIPLSIGEEKVFGVLSFPVLGEERAWTDSVIRGFTLLAQMFSNVLVRKKTEIALRESQAELLLTTNAMGAALWDMEIGTGSVWATEAIRVLLYFAPDEELNEKSFYKKMHPDDREAVKKLVKQATQSGEIFDCEYRIILPDGDIRWIAARGQRHSNLPEESDYLLGVSFDITDRKQSEQELKERLRFETLVTEISTSFLIISTDRIDTKVKEAQRRICELLDLDLVALWQLPDEGADCLAKHKGQ